MARSFSAGIRNPQHQQTLTCSIFTDPQCVQLIRKICAKLSPKKVFYENFIVASVALVSVHPWLIAPDERFCRRALTHLPFSEIVYQPNALRPVGAWRILYVSAFEAIAAAGRDRGHL